MNVQEWYRNTEFAKFRRALSASTIPDMVKLNLLNTVHKDFCDNGTSKRLAERKYLHQAGKKFGEKGKVAVVWSGMDCDCSSYENVVHIVNSDWKSILEDIEETYSWADGPCSYWITSPSEAKKLRHNSRDLALEAHEDGHPHYITW